MKRWAWLLLTFTMPLSSPLACGGDGCLRNSDCPTDKTCRSGKCELKNPPAVNGNGGEGGEDSTPITAGSATTAGTGGTSGASGTAGAGAVAGSGGNAGTAAGTESTAGAQSSAGQTGDAGGAGGAGGEASAGADGGLGGAL